MNTIIETSIRTKRLELLRNYFHSCLRGDCLPNFNMFVCLIVYKNIYLIYIYNLTSIFFYTLYFKLIFLPIPISPLEQTNAYVWPLGNNCAPPFDLLNVWFFLSLFHCYYSDAYPFFKEKGIGHRKTKGPKGKVPQGN